LRAWYVDIYRTNASALSVTARARQHQPLIQLGGNVFGNAARA